MKQESDEAYRVRLATAEHCAALAEGIAKSELADGDTCAAEMAIYLAGYIRRHYGISGVPE